MTKKEIDKKLKELVSKMPPEITQIKIPLGGVDETGAPILYEYDVWTNHARRLRRIWNRTHSLEELRKYFEKFNMELWEENELRETETMPVLMENGESMLPDGGNELHQESEEAETRKSSEKS